VDFTREPIIETIITPKDGCKLVVRSSKSTGQEEYFVDAVEVVSFGHAFFFRSLERPKSFLVPVSDYEVLEVREARMVLKNVGPDRSIKIGGGRESQMRVSREAEKGESASTQGTEEEAQPETAEVSQPTAESAEPRTDVRVDKKRDRRRHYRKRKGGREEGKEEASETAIPALEDDKIDIPPPQKELQGAESLVVPAVAPALLSSLLQPPPTLISETIGRYRENALFKSAFFLTEEEQYKPHDKVQELLNEEEEFVQQESIAEEEKEDQEEAENIENQEEPQVESSAETPPLEEQPVEPRTSEKRSRKVREEPVQEKEEQPINEPSQEASLPLFAEEENSHEEEPPFIFLEQIEKDLGEQKEHQ
jgi:hypothetical protein